MLSFPSAAGNATRAEAMVAYISNGYGPGGCKTVQSSGNKLADDQACKTVSFFKTSKPIYSVTSVWIPPAFEGNFVPPNIKNPRVVSDPNAYPNNDLRQGNQGTTTVKLTLDASGKVSDCSIAQSSGFVSLDRVTCRQQSRGKYKPAMLDGEKISATIFSPMYWGAGSGPPRTSDN